MPPLALASLVCSVVLPALRAIGNIVSGDDKQTDQVVECGVFNACVSLLGHAKQGIRKEARRAQDARRLVLHHAGRIFPRGGCNMARTSSERPFHALFPRPARTHQTCWALSNIAAGNIKQVAGLVQCSQLLQQVIETAANDDWEVRKEAAWVISNICSSGAVPHIAEIVKLGALEVLVSLLHVPDTKIIVVALEALECVLSKGGEESAYRVKIAELGGVSLLEGLEEVRAAPRPTVAVMPPRSSRAVPRQPTPASPLASLLCPLRSTTTRSCLSRRRRSSHGGTMASSSYRDDEEDDEATARWSCGTPGARAGAMFETGLLRRPAI